MYGEYEEDFKFLSFDEEVNKQVSMEMLNGFIHRMIGMVSVKEQNDIVTIEGVSVERLFHDIKSYFSTSKVASNLFRTAKGNKVTLHSFFLIDFEYIVRVLANLPKTRLGKRTYIKIKEELKLNTWIGRLEKDLPSIFNLEKLNEIKYGLLKHQKEFIDYYDKIIPRYGLKGLLLAADPGLGKTISSIAVACCYEAENVIVISPKNAVFRVWESTLKNDMAVPQTVWVQASGQPMPSPNDNRWFVFHYESLDKAIELANMIKDRKTTVILDECLHKDTEVLTPNGFKKITEVTTDDYILQYNLDGTNSWVKPSRIVVSETLESHHYVNKNWEQHVTPNHRMIHWSVPRNPNRAWTLTESLSKDFKLTPNTRTILSGNLSNSNGSVSELSFLERLLIACQADGSINYVSDCTGIVKVDFQLIKDRKISRLLGIVESLGYNYSEYPDRSKDDNRRRFVVRIPLKDVAEQLNAVDPVMAIKDFTKWVNLTDKTSAWCKEFIDELIEWDGYSYIPNKDGTVIRYYSTISSENMDVVQLIAHNAGIKITRSIQEDNRKETYSDVHRAYIHDKTSTPNGRTEKRIVKYDVPEKFYCVTVPSGMFYVRYNGKISVTGNCHNLNDMKSLRTERFVNMCNSLPKAIIVELSGTPMKALGFEAIPLIKAVDPKFNDECMVAFRKMFGKDALRATDILANRLGIVMYKVSKEETDVKPLEEHYINVKVVDEDRFLLSTIRTTMVAFITERTNYYQSRFPAYERTYENCLKEFEETAFRNKPFSPEYEKYNRFVKIIREKKYTRETFADYTVYCTKYEKQVIEPALRPERRKAFRDAKSVVKYVELKIRGEALGTVLSKARMECNKAIVDAFDFTEIIDNAEKKTLIFTSYVDVVKATEAKLSNQGYKPICVYADTNSNLPQLISKYGSDENINPLIATYQSLSTAVPLTMANVVILLNQPFRIHEKEQAMARANRLGQDKQVRVYNVLLDTGNEPNISTRSMDIMEWSRQQVNAIMGFENDIDVGIESFDELIEDVNEEVSVESKSLVNTHTTSSFEEDGTVKVWDVSKIWKLTANYPVKSMAVDYVYDTIKDDVAKFREEDYIKVEKADLSYPIIFNNQMGVIDGIHRVFKAKKQGLKTIDVKHLLIMPEADYVFNSVEEWEVATQHSLSTESIMSDLAIKSEVIPSDVAKKIKEFEDECGFKFPKELVDYFKNYSGGNRFIGVSDDGYEEFCTEALDIDGSKDVWDEHAGNDGEADADHGVNEVYFDDGWIPLFTNGDDLLICMDLNPAPGGKKGQLIGVPVHQGYRENLNSNWKYDVFQPRLNPLSKKLDYLEKILKTKTPKELVEFYDKTLPNLSNGRVVEGNKKLNLQWSDTPYGGGSTGVFLEKFKVKCAVLAEVGEDVPFYSVCYVFNTEGYQDGEIHLFSHDKHLGKVSDTLKDFLTKDVIGVMYLLLGINPNDGAKTNNVKKEGFFSRLFKRK